MKNMVKAICLELDNDIDDFVAYKYLEALDLVDYVVLSPEPITEQGVALKKEISKPIYPNFVIGTGIIYNGGAFTKIAKFVEKNKLTYLIANGGFVGNNLERNPLAKFKNKKEVRTFNFNIDKDATKRVLSSSNIEKIVLTGKNVCHDERNVCGGEYWKNDALLVDICAKYHVREGKLQHDLLAFMQGLKLIDGEETMFDYLPIRPYETDGDKWGSIYDAGSNIFASVTRHWR